MRIAVTGATGYLGGLVIDKLLARDVAASDIVAIVRNEEKAQPLAERGVGVAVATFDDEAALTAALEGVDCLVFISASEVGKRICQHSYIVYAAKATVVYLIYYLYLHTLYCT